MSHLNQGVVNAYNTRQESHSVPVRNAESGPPRFRG